MQHLAAIVWIGFSFWALGVMVLRRTSNWCPGGDVDVEFVFGGEAPRLLLARTTDDVGLTGVAIGEKDDCFAF